jgi:ferritin-like metal-binding protein YciE
MTTQTLKGLLADELETLLSIESQVADGLPAIRRFAHTLELAHAIAEHTTKTRRCATGIKRFQRRLGRNPNQAPDAAIRAILATLSSVEKRYSKGNLRDAALLPGLQRMAHYRSAVYSSALALAQQLGEDQILELLKEGATEDELTAKRFAQIALQVNAEAFIDT